MRTPDKQLDGRALCAVGWFGVLAVKIAEMGLLMQQTRRVRKLISRPRIAPRSRLSSSQLYLSVNTSRPLYFGLPPLAVYSFASIGSFEAECCCA